MSERSSVFLYRSVVFFVALLCSSVLAACVSSAPTDTSPFPISNLHPLEVNTAKADRLGNSDSVNPRDGAPYRTYELFLVEDDILRIVVESSDFSPGIALFGPDGSLIGSTESRTRSSQITTSHSHDPYGYGSYGGHGTLGGLGAYGGYGGFGGYGELDAFGQPHAGTHDSVSGRKSLIRRAAQPGRYLVVISSLEVGELGAFQLSTETVEPSAAFRFPGKVTDFLYEGGRIHPQTRALLNVHTLDLGEDTAVELKVNSSDFTPQLSIVERDTETVLAQTHPQIGARDSSILTELPAGNYEIWITAFHSGPDGRYTLDGQLGEIQRTESFVLGQTFRSFLGWNRTTIPSSMRKGEAMEFELDEPAIINALMHTTDFNSYLVLTDEDGRILREDQDSGWNYNAQHHWQNPPVYDARIYWLLKPGKYTLWATSAMPQESGAYRVTTALHKAPDSDQVAVGESVEGALTQASEIYQPRYTPIEYITLTVEVAGEVRIDLAQHEFEAFLILEDEFGQTIVEMEYDYYAASRAQITQDLAPGTYRIGVTSVAPNEIGSFTLRVRTTGPSGQHG